MNRHLKETLKRMTLPLVGGEFIDAYNRTIRRDDIAGTIDAGIDFRNEKYVVVNDGDNCLRHKE